MTVPFPIAWSWSIQVPRRSRDSQLAHSDIDALAAALRLEGAKSVVAQQDSVQFACPGITGMSRTALLAPISSGSITVSAKAERMELSYSLQFVLTFWASLAFSFIFALLSIGNAPLKIGLLAFSWLFFGNVAISLFRFPRFLRRVLSGSSPPNTSLERSREG